MKSLKVQRYSVKKKKAWDDFVSKAELHSILFYRDFMEYHSDRFVDYSLMVYENKKLIAIMPANIDENGVIHSHQGLSFGGLLYKKNTSYETIKHSYTNIFNLRFDNNVSKIFINFRPVVYNESISKEIKLLQSFGGSIYKSYLSMIVDLKKPIKIHKSKLKRFNKQKVRFEFRIELDNNFNLFWSDILIPCLKEKHNSKPVHSIEEIRFLHKLFPKNIIQWNLYFKDELISGVTLFFKEGVVRSQYGATKLGSEKYFSLEFLFIHLMNYYSQKGFYFFDMGSIPKFEDKYPKGLIKYKRELGCVDYEQNIFSVNLNK